jgi:DNA-binding MarR family transcriptional regulator
MYLPGSLTLSITLIHHEFTMRRPSLPSIPGLPSHTGAETHLVRALMRAHQAVVAAFSREIGLPAARLSLMRALAFAGPAGIGPADLARGLSVHPAAVTRQLQALGRAGLVTRRGDASDRRRTSVRLTPAGLQLFRRVHERGHALERQLAEGLSLAEVEAAVRVLDRLRTALGRLAHLEEAP